MELGRNPLGRISAQRVGLFREKKMNANPIQNPRCALGHSEHELARLSLQGQAVLPFTLQLFEQAGIRSGMHVLDVGSGGGDVSFLATEMEDRAVKLSAWTCWGDGSAEGAGDNTAWSAAVGNGNGSGPDLVFPAGESTYNVYLISDTVQNVTARMDDLFVMGVK
jgi:hypothetical protein